MQVAAREADLAGGDVDEVSDVGDESAPLADGFGSGLHPQLGYSVAGDPEARSDAGRALDEEVGVFA